MTQSPFQPTETDNKAPFELATAFAVPLATARMPNCGTTNQALRDLFVERAALGDAYANPEPRVRRNKTLFESRFNLFDWPEDCVQTLRKFCIENLFRVVQQINGYDQSTLQQLHYGMESWYHITYQGGYFGAHNHPNHSWSGVYCVRHDGDEPASNSGRLTFINPNVGGTFYVDAASVRFQHPYSMAPLMLRLEPGQLVLFPSWVLHEVMPYEGDTERITVAFNVRFRYSGSGQL